LKYQNLKTKYELNKMCKRYRYLVQFSEIRGCVGVGWKLDEDTKEMTFNNIEDMVNGLAHKDLELSKNKIAWFFMQDNRYKIVKTRGTYTDKKNIALSIKRNRIIPIRNSDACLIGD
tara:strand:- start:572 stop:922 length:351 start_codon:yes stop_codon:yes gene_type:complete